MAVICKKCKGDKTIRGEICPMCNGAGFERRIRRERRKDQVCPLPMCEYPIAPILGREVGHFYFIHQPTQIRVEHIFTSRRILKQRRK